MANAQAEPSMDEILASIRRIISEDDEGTTQSPKQKLDTLDLRHDSAELKEEAPAAASEDLEDLEAVEVEADDDAFAAVAEALEVEEAPVAEEIIAEEELTKEVVAAEEPKANIEDEAEAIFASEPVEEAPVFAEEVLEETVAEEPAPEPEPTLDRVAPVAETGFVAAAAAAAAVTRAPVAQPETSLTFETVVEKQIETATEGSILDVTTSNAASNAFAALDENMRISTGQGRTLEDVVEAMLQPMLKDWLDANLSRIVEEKVEEEVRRIARRR